MDDPDPAVPKAWMTPTPRSRNFGACRGLRRETLEHAAASDAKLWSMTRPPTRNFGACRGLRREILEHAAASDAKLWSMPRCLIRICVCILFTFGAPSALRSGSVLHPSSRALPLPCYKNNNRRYLLYSVTSSIKSTTTTLNRPTDKIVETAASITYTY